MVEGSTMILSPSSWYTLEKGERNDTKYLCGSKTSNDLVSSVHLETYRHMAWKRGDGMGARGWSCLKATQAAPRITHSRRREPE